MVEPPEKSKPRAWMILLSLLLILLVVTLAASQEMARFRDFIAGSGWVGQVVIVFIYAVLGATPIPTEPLTVLASTIFGPLYATGAASIGNLLAGLLEYVIGLQIGDVASFEQRREKMPFNLGNFPVDSPVFLIAGRMLPGYGSKAVSIVAGVYRVNLWRYSWTMLAATIPGAAIVAYGGLELLQLLFNR